MPVTGAVLAGGMLAAAAGGTDPGGAPLTSATGTLLGGVVSVESKTR